MRQNFRFSRFIFNALHQVRSERNCSQNGHNERKRFGERHLRLEKLEDRRLLAVTAAEYEEIRASFTEFDLPAVMGDLNVIEVTAQDGTLNLSDLTAAVHAAVATSQSDLIVVRTTDSAHTIHYSKVADELAIKFDTDASEPLTIVGYGSKPLTLDASNQSRVMNISNGTVQLGNITLTNGTTSGYGAGLYNSGKTILSGCVISSNVVTGYYSSGGGVCNTSSGNLTLVDSLVEKNSISGSFASLGGGISNEYGNLTVIRSEIRDNIVNGSNYNLGGGICNNAGVLTVTDSIVHDNTVALTNFYSLGGGVCNGGTAVMTGCLVYANSSTHGGGVGSQNVMSIFNSTISGNTSTTGGGLWAYGVSDQQYTIDLYNVILAGNTATTGTDVQRYNRYITLSAYNTLSTYTAWANAQTAVNYVFDSEEPLFADAAGNDFTLAAGSQAVDVGGNDFVTTQTDLAGNPRIVNDIVDMGSYERQMVTAPLPLPTELVAHSIGANGHQVSWNGVEDAIGYEVAYSTDQVNWETISSAEVSTWVTGLTYGAEMFYKVRALGDGVNFTHSDWTLAVSLRVCPMDIDGDGRIGPADRTLLASAWLSRPSSANWDIRCDIDGNKTVASGDRTFLTSNYLKAATASDLTYPAALADQIETTEKETDKIAFSLLPEEKEGLLLESISVPSVASVTSAILDLDVMNLSSKADSDYYIYLDFDGHVTSGTQWNSVYTEDEDIVTPRFNLDGDSTKTSFSTEEQAAIYIIWLRVAEDYMPFDLNVTTIEPDETAFTSGQAVRIVIGGSYSDWYGASAGGVSYVGDFIWKSDTPSFVFSDNLYGSVKYLAETTTHESGHTLGLSHKGSSVVEGQSEYYEGTNGWAPIMGAAYYEELTQWSAGEYYGATNQNDELETITTRNGFTYRTDDYANNFTNAKSLTITSGTGLLSGIIEQNTDVDYFVFESDGTTLDFHIGGIKDVTNLDVLVRIYDVNKTEIMVYDPTDRLDVEFLFTEVAGTYYLTVEGTGQETSWAGIYSDYGSLGAYEIAVGYPNVLTVTTLNDSLESDGYLSLREALLLATGRTRVVFDASLTGGTILLENGEMTLDGAIQIDASKIGGITIDADSQSSIFKITGDVVLKKLTLTGGAGTTKGAAIMNSGTVTIIDSLLSGNIATERSEYLVGGGALYNNSGATATIIHSTLSNNKGNFGGAIYNAGTLTLTETGVENNASWCYYAGGIYNTGTLTVFDSVFTGNITSDKSGYTVGGGAVYNANDATATFTGTLFTQNKATLGGAIFNLGTCALDDVAMSLNSLWSNKGGAIFNSGLLNVTDSVFSGNFTMKNGNLTVGGGAIWNASSGTALVTQSLFYGNQGDLGGALFNAGNFTLSNSTVAKNVATNSCGGGIFNHAGTFTVNNSILVENVSASNSSQDIYLYDGTMVGSNNLSTFVDWENGTGNIVYSTESPLFTDLTGNDFTLAAGSQAVDVGGNDFVTTQTDLAGNPRIVNDIVDMGSYERQIVTAPLPLPTELVAHSIGANGHQVSWNGGEDAIGYEVAYSTDQMNWETISSAEVSTWVTGLTYGAEMFYKVRALGDGVNFTHSDWTLAVSLRVCPMDIDGDGRIGPADRTLLASAWLSRPSSTNWDVRCDIDGNKTVASGDRTFLTSNYLKATTASDLTYPPALAEALFASEVLDEIENDFISPSRDVDFT